jgi:hypothetical protein
LVSRLEGTAAFDGYELPRPLISSTRRGPTLTVRAVTVRRMRRVQRARNTLQAVTAPNANPVRNGQPAFAIAAVLQRARLLVRPPASPQLTRTSCTPISVPSDSREIVGSPYGRLNTGPGAPAPRPSGGDRSSSRLGPADIGVHQRGESLLQQLILLNVAMLLAFVGYREAASFEKQYGNCPWRTPPLAWAIGCFFFGFIGALFLLVAETSTKRRVIASTGSSASPPQPRPQWAPQPESAPQPQPQWVPQPESGPQPAWVPQPESAPQPQPQWVPQPQWAPQPQPAPQPQQLWVTAPRTSASEPQQERGAVSHPPAAPQPRQQWAPALPEAPPVARKLYLFGDPSAQPQADPEPQPHWAPQAPAHRSNPQPPPPAMSSGDGTDLLPRPQHVAPRRRNVGTRELPRRRR